MLAFPTTTIFRRETSLRECHRIVALVIISSSPQFRARKASHLKERMTRRDVLTGSTPALECGHVLDTCLLFSLACQEKKLCQTLGLACERARPRGAKLSMTRPLYHNRFCNGEYVGPYKVDATVHYRRKKVLLLSTRPSGFGHIYGWTGQ